MFADSPEGGGQARPVDASTGGACPLLRAKVTSRTESTPTHGDGTDRLLESVAEPENLATALARVARNRGAPGVDRVSVREVVRRADDLLPALRDALLSEDYVPGDVRRVWIPKPSGGQRGLGIPNVLDRVVQQAVLQVLEPIYEPTFHDSSHGFRPGRSAKTAITEALGYIQEGCIYTVDIDLEKFFDRVNHQRLLSRLGQRVADPRLLRVVRLMLKASVVLPDGTRVSTEAGTPQGGPLSPLLSNIVLDELDQELARRGLRFVRYADDCNIYVRSERSGHRIMASVRRFIERRVRLKVNEAKSAVDRTHRRHFLGFRLGEYRGHASVQLSERSRKRLADQIRALTPRNWGGSLRSCMDRLASYLRGWIGYFRLCTSGVRKWLRYFDAHIRRRLRAIAVRQKKRSRHLFRHLLKRGVRRRTASAAAYASPGIWRKSHTSGVEQAWSNQWFAARLPSLDDLFFRQRHRWADSFPETSS